MSARKGRRTVSAGYETVMDEGAVAALASFLDTVSVGGVAVNAGRADWATFRWAGHEADWCFRDERPDGDPFEEAAAALSRAGVRKVTAVVDVFVERSTAARSVTADGKVIAGQVSLSELLGSHGRALTEMCAALAARPTVDAVNLTELQYDDGGFGADDLGLFQAGTGLTDWPRDAEGKIIESSPVIGAWRSSVIAQFVRGVAEVVHAHGKTLIVDVRAPGPGRLRRATAFGLDYLALLDAGADKLGVWHFIGSSTADRSHLDALTTLRSVSPDRITVEVGLWDADDEAMGPEGVAFALAQAERSGFHDVWVTPAGLLTLPIQMMLWAFWS